MSRNFYLEIFLKYILDHKFIVRLLLSHVLNDSAKDIILPSFRNIAPCVKDFDDLILHDIRFKKIRDLLIRVRDRDCHIRDRIKSSLHVKRAFESGDAHDSSIIENVWRRDIDRSPVPESDSSCWILEDPFRQNYRSRIGRSVSNKESESRSFEHPPVISRSPVSSVGLCLIVRI